MTRYMNCQLANKIRILLNGYKVRRYCNEDWMRKIRACQKDICDLDPHPHYLKEYKDSEVAYWLHIPKWIYKYGSQKKIQRVLDIGCAYGTLAIFCKRLFDCEVYCTDFVDTYLSKTLIEKFNINFKVNNIELDDFPWDIKFDIIIFTEVLEHLNCHPIPTLSKIRDLLADEGILYLSTPDASQWGKVTKYYSTVDEIPLPQKGIQIVDDHVYQYNKNELIEIISNSSLKIGRFSYSPGILNGHFNLALVRA